MHQFFSYFVLTHNLSWNYHLVNQFYKISYSYQFQYSTLSTSFFVVIDSFLLFSFSWYILLSIDLTNYLFPGDLFSKRKKVRKVLKIVQLVRVGLNVQTSRGIMASLTIITFHLISTDCFMAGFLAGSPEVVSLYVSPHMHTQAHVERVKWLCGIIRLSAHCTWQLCLIFSQP